MNQLQEPFSAAFFQIRDYYEKCPFIQVKLMPSETFTRYLDERDLSFNRDTLQTFSSILAPVRVTDDPRDMLYHPYQSWVAYRLKILVSLHLDWSYYWTVSPDQLNNSITRQRERVTESMVGFIGWVEEFYRLLALMVKADPYCVPIVRQKISLHPTLEMDGYRQYHCWRRTFDVKSSIEESSLTIDKIKEWHRTLSLDAHRTNDAEEWYLLMRHATFEKRDKLKGNLRLSFDFYEMAESLRILLSAAGENLPAEDDYIGGGYWKKGFYGVETIDFAKRQVLKELLREYGIDASYKVYWFVEGATELGFIQTFAEGIGTNIEERGIAVINLGGTGDLTARRKEVGKRLKGAQSFVELLRRLKADEVFTFITIDDDQDVSEGLESLRREELLTAGFIKWVGDFEQGNNFTSQEIIKILQQVATNPIEITEQEIDEEKNKLNTEGKPRALGEAVEALAKRKPGLEQFSKGEEWGKALCRYILATDLPGAENRPIIKAFFRVLNTTDSDFRGTLENLECNSSGEIVRRTKKL